MSIQLHVDALKYKLQQGSASRDRRYADPFLKHMLVAARKSLLKKRIEKGEILPDYLYQTQCVDFIDSELHDCNCAMGACSFKVSKYKLPDILSYQKEMKLEVLNLNGEPINSLTLDQNRLKDKYALNKEKNLSWSFFNKRIVLQNASKITKLLIKYISIDDTTKTLEDCGINGIVCYSERDFTFYDDDAILYDAAVRIILGKNYDRTNNKIDETILNSAELVK